MLKENKVLKLYLVLQSFSPLFALILIKHIGHFDLVRKFFSRLFRADFSVVVAAFQSAALGDVVVSAICILWLIGTVIVALAFRDFQRLSFDHHGESILIGEEKEDSGVTFLVSFVLPLLVDDISTLRDLLFFVALLSMVIVLLMKSNLFYQNPVLTALHYKTYEFKFMAPSADVSGEKTYIGITLKNKPTERTAIKRKYIADGVFIIYNE